MNVVYAVSICLALAVTQGLFGGGLRLVYCLPGDGVLALAGLLSLVDIRRPKPSADGWCLASSALFFGYVLARSLTSPVAYLAWFDRYMVLAALVLYLLTACLLTDPRRRLWVLAGLLVLAVVNVVIGGKQFAGGGGEMLFGTRPAQYADRASGLYICPDHLAGYLEVVVCLAIPVALWSRCGAGVKILVGYLALCSLAGLVITASRGGYLSMAVGLGVLTTLGLLRARAAAPGLLPRALVPLVVAVAVAAGGIGVGLRQSPLLRGRASAMFDHTDIRLRLWPAAWRQFQLDPAVGTGSATYLYYGREFRDPQVQSDPIRPHSDYLELLAEYGAVGAAGLLLFLGAHLRRGWRTFRHLSLRPGEVENSNAAAWNAGCLAAVACLAVHSVVDFNLHIPANTLLMAFVFGQLANPGRALPGGEPVVRWRRSDLLARLALPALGIWLLAEALPKLPGEILSEKARVALRDGHQMAAINFAQQGLEREPRNPLLDYYLGEARLLIAAKREETGHFGPDDPVVASFRRDAAEAYRAALDLAPDDSVLLMRLGETLTLLGRFDEAGPVFAHLLVQDPNSGLAQTYVGVYLQRAGHPAEAAATYRRALALSPQPAARTGLAQILQQQPEAAPAAR